MSVKAKRELKKLETYRSVQRETQMLANFPSRNDQEFVSRRMEEHLLTTSE